MFVVYILQSQTTQKYYIGYTHDLMDRLSRHNGNREKATKNRGPWKIVRQELFESRVDAMYREKQIKSYKGGNAFKMLFTS